MAANQITPVLSLSFLGSKMKNAVGLALTTATKFTAAGSERFSRGTVQCATSPAILDISSIGAGTLGYYAFMNLDAAININIMSATAGVVIITLLPGEMAVGRFPSNITAPAVESASGTPLLDYFILEA